MVMKLLKNFISKDKANKVENWKEKIKKNVVTCILSGKVIMINLAAG